MSDIRDGLRDIESGRKKTTRSTSSRGSPPRKPTPSRPQGPARPARGGLMDAILTLAVLAIVIARTPVGALLWYGSERVRGVQTEMPSLTAYFSGGAVAPPTDITLPPTAGEVQDDQLPEPWRTAVRTTLAAGLPPSLVEQLAARGQQATPEAALAEIDTQWSLHRDPSLILEVAALGSEQRDRAIARAMSAGEPEPKAYESYRRYLPGPTALEADRFVGGTLALATALDLTWPLSVPHRLSSPFGDRNHPVLGRTKFHEGVDLAVPIGTQVLAAQRATVAVVGESAVSGRYVVLDHGYGVRTSYCHLQTTPVQQGTEVARGEVFALSGNTGRSTGPHLHYGIKIAGRWVDPERFRR